MKFGLIATAAVAALAVGSATASAQYIVPHRGHYHVVPSYSPPLVYGGGYSYPSYSVPSYGGGHGGYGYGGYGSGFGSVVVPHTTTHGHVVPHRGHYHVVPHTTTHFHSVSPW